MPHRVFPDRTFPRHVALETPKIAAIGIPAVVLGLVIFGATAFSEAPSAPVVMPLEVIGAQGHVVSATVNVTDPSGIDRLWIQGNSVGFIYETDSKGSVRLNGGSWVPIVNSRVTCDFPEVQYGCVESGLSTIRFTLPVSGVVAGSNTIDFRFDRTDGFSVGWRVLDFNFLRSNGSKVLPASAFTHEDPATWSPPRTSSADIAAGKQLWDSATLVDSPLSSAQIIKAKCADCHAKSGEDLKYFSFSNKSIIARSVFHGLSQADGEKIASYIRTLPTQAYGTPWDPPYQPGPGLDSKPVAAWSAGAGLDWVLDEDVDMIPYVFPTSDRTSVTNTLSTLNMREIPIAFQLPDWNHWLPRVHPVDGYGASFKNSEGYQQFSTMIPAALEGYPQSKSIMDTDINNVLKTVFHYTRDYGAPWDEQSEVNTRAKADAELGFRQWRLIKMWELVHEYPLEDVTAQLYPPDSRGIENGEIRGWPGLLQIPFPLAPHRIATNHGVGPYRNEPVNTYFSTAWYQLQVILNPGFRLATGQSVVDWKYHLPHIKTVDEITGHDQTMRYLASYIKRLQQSDTVAGADYGYGWEWRVGQPSWAWYGEVGYSTHRGALNRTQFREVLEPILQAWISKTEQFSPDEWCRELSVVCLTPASYTPEPYEGSGYFLQNHENATQMYRLIPELDKLGIDPAILERMANWSEVAWPKADWHSLYSGSGGGSNSAPSVGLTSPSNNSSFEVNSTITVKANASDGDGTISKVEFYVGNTRIGTDNSAPYQSNWTPSSTGTFSVSARATDNEGATTTSTARNVSISAAPPPTSTHTVSLQQGWNMVSSYVDPANSDMEAVFAAIQSDILLVKSQSGAQYHPPSGLNTIGSWDPTEAYEVYANAPRSLQITGPEVDPDNSIVLTAGWNHLAFPRNSSLAVDQALATIASKVNIVKDVGGRVYYPAFSVNEIGALVPGQGYKLHLTANATLKYPTSSGKGEESFGNPPPAIASTAVIVVVAPAIADGAVATVTSSDGVSVGQGLIVDGQAVVRVAGDDAFTQTVREGVRKGEVLELSIATVGDTDPMDVTVSSLRNGLTDEIVSDGVIRYSKDAVLIANVEEVPGTAELAQNYPNPFEDVTSIRYSLPADSRVRVDVFNIAGRQLAVLVDGEQQAGWHDVRFDSRGFASGVYLYRLVTDDTIVHKQMLLRK